jgi:hypothetical protein
VPTGTAVRPANAQDNPRIQRGGDKARPRRGGAPAGRSNRRGKPATPRSGSVERPPPAPAPSRSRRRESLVAAGRYTTPLVFAFLLHHVRATGRRSWHGISYPRRNTHEQSTCTHRSVPARATPARRSRRPSRGLRPRSALLSPSPLTKLSPCHKHPHPPPRRPSPPWV